MRNFCNGLCVSDLCTKTFGDNWKSEMCRVVDPAKDGTGVRGVFGENQTMVWGVQC